MNIFWGDTIQFKTESPPTFRHSTFYFLLTVINYLNKGKIKINTLKLVECGTSFYSLYFPIFPLFPIFLFPFPFNLFFFQELGC